MLAEGWRGVGGQSRTRGELKKLVTSTQSGRERGDRDFCPWPDIFLHRTCMCRLRNAHPHFNRRGFKIKGPATSLQSPSKVATNGGLPFSSETYTGDFAALACISGVPLAGRGWGWAAPEAGSWRKGHK